MAKRDLTEAEFKAKKADIDALGEHTLKSLDSGLITPEQAIGTWARMAAEALNDAQDRS